MSLLKEIQEADIVITISRDGIKTIKNRDGIFLEKLDLAKLLEMIISYQEENLKPLIQGWINKLKIYRTFL